MAATATIDQAHGSTDMAAVRDLMRRYVEWHRERHADYRQMIDLYFDAAAYEAELARLPGVYGPPSGRLLIARVDAEPAGCVGLRDLGGGVCEMKRMFIAPAHQGRGLGRALGVRLIAEGRAAGYRVMRLDSGPLQHEAHRLYESLGFRYIEPYYDVPPEMRALLVYMECPLG